MTPMPKVERLDHVVLLVKDLDASEKWYREWLGLEPVHVEEWWSEEGCFLGAGGTMVAIFRTREGGSPLPVRQHGDGGRHIAFRATRSNFDAIRPRLSAAQVPFEEHDHQISRSVYFFDPDGYCLEVTTYDR